jgi:hypothetical protein
MQTMKRLPLIVHDAFENAEVLPYTVEQGARSWRIGFVRRIGWLGTQEDVSGLRDAFAVLMCVADELLDSVRDIRQVH